jgi:hypothetical protein
VIKRTRVPEGVGPRPDTCLYFPYYEVRDETWAKEALLYWDKVATIVPIDVDPRGFNSPLYRTLSEHAAVEAWPVSYWVRDEAARRILSLIDAGKHADLPDGPAFRLNFGKLSDKLIEGLIEREVEVNRKANDVEVDFRVGALVMCSLAHYLGDQTESRPVTDDPALGEAYISVLDASTRSRTIEGLIKRDLDMAVPAIRDIELASWLEFRSKHKRELVEYRASLEGLAREVAGAESPSEADDVIARRKEDLEQALHRGFWKKLTTHRSLSRLSLVIGLPSMAIDAHIGLPLASSVAGAVITVGQLLRRQVHGLTFVQRLHTKFG